MKDEKNENDYLKRDSQKKTVKRKSVTYTVLLLILTNIITAFVVSMISVRLPNGKVIVSQKTFENILTFEKLYTVKDKIDKYYIGDINEDDLITGAAKGMAASLKDPYTSYMDKAQFTEFTTQTEGNYVGLGIQIGAKNDKIVIVSTFENSPAKKAGILAGDEIISVNDEVVSSKDMDKATSIMKGEEGGAVKLIVSRDNDELSFNLKREKIEMVTVKNEMIEDKIGYIQVSMFDENTAKHFKEAIKSLKDSGMESLIVDLRENPGGLLDQTVEMASQFVPKGENIVYTEDKNGEKKDYKSVGGDSIGLPVTILIDGNSASASEIFMGSLQDYGYATLVGETSFGKGVVQTTFYRPQDGFGDGTALKVTISKYFTPNGKNIHGVGISPDVEVKYPDNLREQPYNREKDPQFKKALEVAREKIK